LNPGINFATTFSHFPPVIGRGGANSIFDRLKSMKKHPKWDFLALTELTKLGKFKANLFGHRIRAYQQCVSIDMESH
jgi:hypothetical protein